MTIIGRDINRRQCADATEKAIRWLNVVLLSHTRNCVHFKFTSLRFRSRTRSIEHTNKQNRGPAYANDSNGSFCLLASFICATPTILCMCEKREVGDGGGGGGCMCVLIGMQISRHYLPNGLCGK